MAKVIKLQLPERELKNADVEFRILNDNALIGTFKISKGGIDWWKPNAKKASSKASWDELIKFMGSPK